MKIFITGATGYVGELLTKELVKQGHTIHALARSVAKAEKLIQHPQVKVFQGDLLEPAKIKEAMQDCEQAYHLAAYAKVWDKDPQAFYKMNVLGTRHILEVAQELGVKRVVVTSTAGVFGPAVNGVVDEATPLTIPLSTDYERTKLESEKEIQQFVEKGLDVVIVNPSRVYGPGQMSESNATTKLISMYRLGKWKFLPGNGKSIGNYVFVDDVVKGHILAMEKGRTGERYILGAENASFEEFFEVIRKVTGKQYKLFKMPIWLMMSFAKIQLFLANTFGRPPLITPPFVRRYLFNWILSIEKAKKELGYQPLTLEQGVAKTVEWLEQSENK